MEEPKRRRGRPKEFDGYVQGSLSREDFEYFTAEMARSDRPMARVLRELISEAIAARKAQS